MWYTLCVPVHFVEVISGITLWFLFDIFRGSCAEPVHYLEQYLSLVVRDSSIAYMDVHDACKYDEVYIHIRLVM